MQGCRDQRGPVGTKLCPRVPGVLSCTCPWVGAGTQGGSWKVRRLGGAHSLKGAACAVGGGGVGLPDSQSGKLTGRRSSQSEGRSLCCGRGLGCQEQGRLWVVEAIATMWEGGEGQDVGGGAEQRVGASAALVLGQELARDSGRLGLGEGWRRRKREREGPRKW